MTIYGLILTIIWIPILIALYSPGKKGNGRVYSHEELEAMMREMTGKSQKECRQILKKYR